MGIKTIFFLDKLNLIYDICVPLSLLFPVPLFLSLPLTHSFSILIAPDQCLLPIKSDLKTHYALTLLFFEAAHKQLSPNRFSVSVCPATDATECTQEGSSNNCCNNKRCNQSQLAACHLTFWLIVRTLL